MSEKSEWVLMPKVPTRAMLDAYEATCIAEGRKGAHADFKAYAAMLAAAPAGPVEIAKLRRQVGTWLNATADARLQRDALRQAIGTAIEHIDQHMGDTDPADPEHPLLLAMQALTGTEPSRETLMCEAYIRVLRDGGGKVLPSEAARLVAPMFGVSPVEVILTFGVHRANQEVVHG